ncbi:MAG: hypothetical protein HZC42_15325 [Candidatus Eisenbacteria bacterium]|nr:hypothetical protein [Candidatus Eisenbacteria bacterium]
MPSSARACSPRGRGCLNARLPNAEVKRWCALDAAGRRLVSGAVDRGGMSARGVHRALRVPRTIADLVAEERVAVLHLGEALQYRAHKVRSPVRQP